MSVGVQPYPTKMLVRLLVRYFQKIFYIFNFQWLHHLPTAIVAMALCGVIFIMNKDDISGGFKLLLSVVFGISFIAFAASIVNSVFSFSGAVI